MPPSKTWAGFAVLALALAIAAPVYAQRTTTMLPGAVRNFELPNFNENTGDKEWELFGEKASYKSDTRIDVESFRLLLFEDGPGGALKAEITSPSARVDPVKKFVSGDSDIFVRAPEFKIDGKKWTWDSAKKFVEVFGGISVDISPRSGGESGDSRTRITGEYGSMLGGGDSNVFDVRRGVRLENSQMRLECDALRAVAPKERAGGSGVSEIDAGGNIKMLYENKDVRAGSAKILPDKSTALLSGSPHITDIPSRAEISGSSIEIDRAKKSLCALSGESGRACAVIFNTGSDGAEERIAISADSIKMRTEGGENFFDFAGGVKVDADSFSASCDSLSARSSSRGGGRPEVSRIEGGGNVRLSNENGEAAADRMEILPGKGEVALSENASLADPERGMKLFADVIVFLKEKSTGLAFADPEAKDSRVVLKMREGISAGGKKPAEGAETVVKSRRLKFVKGDKNMNFDFDRDVRISSDDIRASCEKMQVLAVRDGKGGDSVRKITATDSVKISQKGYSAEAETAVIYPKLNGGDGGKSAPHRYVELLISPANPGKRPTIFLPATKALGLEEVRAGRGPEEKPTVVTSDKQWLVGGADSDRYFFEGDVKATGTDMDVSCQKAEVEMRRLKSGGHSISKIRLLESVNLSSGMKSATCGAAEVFPEDEMVVLSDDPVVIDREDNTRVSGPRMVYNRGRRSMTVEAEASGSPAAQPAPRAFIPDFEGDETLAPDRNRPPRPTVKMLPRSRK